MMEKDALVQRLMATFVGELEDHVRTLERDLLALEKTPAADARDQLFAVLFRTAHSLKGAARSVKVELVEQASHMLEEIFGAAREGTLPVDAEFFELLLPVIDAIGEAGRQLRGGGDLGRTRLDHLVSVLTTFKPGTIPPPRPASLEPAAAIRFVEPEPSPSPAAASAAAMPKPSADIADAPPERWRASVRVPAEKLDALLSQSSELLSVRHRANARSDDIAVLQDMLAALRKDWRRIDKSLSALLKRDGGDRPVALSNVVEQARGRHQDTLSRIERNMQRLAGEFDLDRRTLDITAGPLDAEIRRTRMLPFAEACEGLDRMIRDLTASRDKDIRLVIEGGETELDRSVLEGLRDPLIHLVRNAVDHGIEPTSARVAAGKPAQGTIRVAATLRGGRVEVRVEDDGRGIDLDALRLRLRRRGTDVPETDQELIAYIFVQGVSTSPAVTHVSGRGVGLDIVKSRLLSMRGAVDVSFEAGRGTCFTLRLPLTLTTLRAVLLRSGGQIYAVDTASVRRVLSLDLAEIKSLEGRDVLLLDGEAVPLFALGEALGGESRPPAAAQQKILAVVLKDADRQAGFVVDEFRGEHEVVIRTLGPRMAAVRLLGGATLLADGRIGLILNAAELIADSLRLAPAASLMPIDDRAQAPLRKRLLVADDSITVRTLEKSILEAAGYDVTLAADGAQAWQILLEQGADLVISDVDMPHMDGFALTEAIRGSRRFRALPVILVTAKETETDKARGLAVGADAYQLKSAFDQTDLIVTIQQIL